MTSVEVPLSPLNNFRDLGGLPVAGGTTATGVLWRSDDVSVIPEDDATGLAGLGLRTIIDLRSPGEASHTGRGSLGAHDIHYNNLPLTQGAAGPDEFHDLLRTGAGTPELVGTWYARTAVLEAANIVRGIRIIADSDGPTLVHCSAGKDRTGIFVACALTLAGADEDTIAADYALSEQVLPAIMARVSSVIGSLLGDSAPYFAAVADSPGPYDPLLGAHPDSMRTMLRVLASEHGGIVEVLRSAGLDQALEDRFREKFVV